MQILRCMLVGAILSSAANASPVALAPGGHVADFMLLDQHGAAHQLYKMSAKKAIVVMTQSNGCPIVRLAIPALREIRARYQAQGVEFLLLNPTLQDTREAVTQEAEEFKFDMTILLDRTQRVGLSWGVNRTAEVFVIDPKNWTLVYHGPIDDRLNYETQHPLQHANLTDALDAVHANKTEAEAAAASPGCLINFPNRRRPS
jgi:peroxiredoxin